MKDKRVFNYVKQREAWIDRQLKYNGKQNIYKDKSQFVKKLPGRSGWLEITDEGYKKLENLIKKRDSAKKQKGDL